LKANRPVAEPIHRYINQPSPVFAEILLLREAVLGTLPRARRDPRLRSVAELERVTDKFLNGFGELRAVRPPSRNLSDQVLVRP
jgi:hypothetical protein